MSGTTIDWQAVKNELRGQEWEKDLENDGVEVRAVFLGTVMALFPSGKYWTCFACNNVDEAEQEADITYLEYLETGAESIGAGIESGMGDPCDILVAEYREYETALEGKLTVKAERLC